MGRGAPGSDALRALADYTLARHYPELADAPEKYLALFDAIVERQARLIARWQLVGFIHGVMNTDNMAISGETIDYGPCAFMDALRSRDGVQLDRSWRPICVRQSAADRAVESRPAGRGHVAAVRGDAIAPSSGPPPRSSVRGAVRRALAGWDAREARAVHRRRMETRRSSTTSRLDAATSRPTSRTRSDVVGRGGRRRTPRAQIPTSRRGTAAGTRAAPGSRNRPPRPGS